MTRALKPYYYILLFSLQSCSSDNGDHIAPSGLSSLQFGMGETRHVRVTQVQSIHSGIGRNGEPIVILKVGRSASTYVKVFLNCSRLRSGYYFSEGREDDSSIDVQAYWHGLFYKKTDDSFTYSRVKLIARSSSEINIKIYAVLKETSANKIIVVNNSNISIPSYLFKGSIEQCH